MDKHVWQILTDPGTSFVRLFAKPTRAGDPPLGRTIENAQEWAAQVPAPPHYNIYVHLNPTRPVRRLRASAYDASKWAFLLVDMDPEGDRIPPEAEAMLALQMLQDKLTEEVHADFSRAAVIYSGRGAQLWVRLTPLVITPGDTATVDKIGNACNRFLTSIASWAPKGYRIDTTGDLARIARLPGSRNLKSMNRAELVDMGSVARPSLTDKLLSFYQPVDVRPGEQGPGFGTHDWRDVEDQLTARAKNFIWHGEDEGDRHGSCQHACKTMWELGVSVTSADEALMMGASVSRPPLTQADVKAIIRQVYSKPRESVRCGTNCSCSAS